MHVGPDGRLLVRLNLGTSFAALRCAHVGGGSAISDFDVTNNSAHTVWQGPEGIHAFGNFPNFALSRDGKIAAAVRSTYNLPPEVFAGSVGKWRELTNNNTGLQANWGKAESIEWTNEGSNIQGWLVPPAKIDPGKKYPMVVFIHGGPSGVTTSDWPASFGMSRAITAALPPRGYYVLLPNPRGSYGQGEEFTRANVKDFGGGDLRDVSHGPLCPTYFGRKNKEGSAVDMMEKLKTITTPIGSKAKQENPSLIERGCS